MDMRAPKKTAQRWQLSENKIGCISVNPADPRFFATAHLNRAMRIWDARALKEQSQDAHYTDIQEACMFTECAHNKACSSAYFDPTGKFLLTTSYDDRLRVWNVNDVAAQSFDEPDVIVKHNNQTGRYVSVRGPINVLLSKEQ